MIQLLPTPDGLSRAVPVILLDQTKWYAEQTELELAHGFQVKRNRRDHIVWATEVQHTEPATPRKHTNTKGNCFSQHLPDVGRVCFALTGVIGS